MTTGERIKAARIAAKMTQSELAEKVGVKYSAIHKYESGLVVNLKRETIAKLADALRVKPSYLLCIDDESDQTTAPSRGVRIPVFGDVAAGVPVEAMENIVDWEEIEPELAATGTFYGLRIRGSSMEPRICEGDVVIVRKQNDADTGNVAIVLVNGDSATCKRIKKEASGLTLIPFNPSYEIKHYSPEEIAALPVRIIGKVVELRGKF